MKESRISALLDGELEKEESLALLAGPEMDERLKQDWQVYHVIGDALRHTSPLFSSKFNAEFAARLADEPAISAPQASLPRSRETSSPTPHFLPRGNGKLVGWSVGAVVVAVSVAGWLLQPGSDVGMSASKAPIMEVTELDQASAAANAVSGYLTAHQEFSSTQQETSRYQRASMDKAQGRNQ